MNEDNIDLKQQQTIPKMDLIMKTLAENEKKLVEFSLEKEEFKKEIVKLRDELSKLEAPVITIDNLEQKLSSPLEQVLNIDMPDPNAVNPIDSEYFHDKVNVENIAAVMYRSAVKKIAQTEMGTYKDKLHQYTKCNVSKYKKIL